MARRYRTDLGRHRGQSLVEFALVLPIFLLVLMGLFDLGRGVYAYITINNAAREAARLAIVDQTPGHAEAEAAKQSVALGLTAVNIDYRDADTPADPASCAPVEIGCIAAVEVMYTFQAVTPVIGQIIGPFDITGESRFAVEALCSEPQEPACPPGD